MEGIASRAKIEIDKEQVWRGKSDERALWKDTSLRDEFFESKWTVFPKTRILSNKSPETHLSRNKSFEKQVFRESSL